MFEFAMLEILLNQTWSSPVAKFCDKFTERNKVHIIHEFAEKLPGRAHSTSLMPLLSIGPILQPDLGCSDHFCSGMGGSGICKLRSTSTFIPLTVAPVACGN